MAIFERVINTAFDQKLAPGALSVDVLDSILYHIKETAAKNKFHNFVHQPSYLYKLEVSFIHRAEEQTVILLLHVPFVETENLLPLFEFISLPIYFNFSSNVSVIPDVGKTDLIAIGNTEAFQTLSTSDLANCKRLGNMFFCDVRSVLQTNIVKNCLGSLYLGSSSLIKDNCKFRIDNTRENIYYLGNNFWVVYSIGTIATNQVCPRANEDDVKGQFGFSSNKIVYNVYALKVKNKSSKKKSLPKGHLTLTTDNQIWTNHYSQAGL